MLRSSCTTTKTSPREGDCNTGSWLGEETVCAYGVILALAWCFYDQTKPNLHFNSSITCLTDRHAPGPRIVVIHTSALHYPHLSTNLSSHLPGYPWPAPAYLQTCHRIYLATCPSIVYQPAIAPAWLPLTCSYLSAVGLWYRVVKLPYRCLNKLYLPHVSLQQFPANFEVWELT